MLLDYPLQRDQVAVEKMPGTGKHDHGERLRPRPVEHVFQCNDIIFLAMHDQRIFPNVADRKTPDRRGHQYQVPRRQLLRHGRSNKTAKRETTDRKLAVAVSTPRVFRQREKILDFAAPFVEDPVAGAYAAKIQPQGRVPQRDKRLGQCLHDFVVQRAAKKRMGMRDQRDAAPCCGGFTERYLELAHRAVDGKLLWRRGFQMRRRSTTRPFTRCSSMISSMSSLST